MTLNQLLGILRRSAMANTEIKPILVAEDNSDDALLLQRAFAKSGVLNPVVIVRDGEEVIRYLNGESRPADAPATPVLILLDIKMPRLNGLETLQWIRKNITSKIPVVMLTASNLEADIEAAKQLGADSYLVKPGSYKELTELIQRLHQKWVIAG